MKHFKKKLQQGKSFPVKETNHMIGWHTNTLYSVSLSPDGQYLFTGSFDNSIRQWEVKTNRCLKVFYGDTESFVLRPDGQYLFTASDDHTIRIWDIQTGKTQSVFHNISKGFLWTKPPAGKTDTSYFWTDRPEMISVYKSYKDGSEPELLGMDEPDRECYISIHNRKDIVMGRIPNLDRPQLKKPVY